MFFVVRPSASSSPLRDRRPDQRKNRSFQKLLTETILLHPSYFGPQMIEYLKTKLHQDVEGTCSGRIGCVLLTRLRHSSTSIHYPFSHLNVMNKCSARTNKLSSSYQGVTPEK